MNCFDIALRVPLGWQKTGLERKNALRGTERRERLSIKRWELQELIKERADTEGRRKQKSVKKALGCAVGTWSQDESWRSAQQMDRSAGLHLEKQHFFFFYMQVHPMFFFQTRRTDGNLKYKKHDRQFTTKYRPKTDKTRSGKLIFSASVLESFKR